MNLGDAPSSDDNLVPHHVAVLVDEVLEWLDPKPGQVIVDGTVGAGGHARAITQRLGPEGRLLGLDLDPMMLDLARQRLAGLPVELIEANFARIRLVLDELGIEAVDGVLLDLGISSDQLADQERGFSFTAEGPLDLRMDPLAGEPASELVNHLGERQLADLFWKYGEERFSRRIARRIVAERRREKIETAARFAELVRRAVPAQARRKQRIDPATRVFQALRIAVNDELDALQVAMDEFPTWLKPGGRAVVISFHSLEDRIVKQAFREKSQWQNLTRKPICPTPAETKSNPRARSAKLRAAQRVA